MNMHCFNNKVFVLAEQHEDVSSLLCFSKYSEAFKQEIEGKITGIKLNGDKLFCVVEQEGDDPDCREVVLYTFDYKLNELSSELVLEVGPSCADVVSGIVSGMDDNCIYIVLIGKAKLDFEDNCVDPIDVISQLEFVRMNIETGEYTDWDLGRSLGKIDGVNELVKITNGFVITVDSLCISKGDLLLGCTVYDPDMEVKFNVGVRKNSDLRSFRQTLRVHFDEQRLSNSSIQLQETWDKTPFSWLRFREEAYKIIFHGEKIYMASSKGFYCIDGCPTNIILLCPWGCTVDDPEMYRDFYVWNDELVFERRDNEKLTGFLMCPASFEEPDCSDWVEIVFDETAV